MSIYFSVLGAIFCTIAIVLVALIGAALVIELWQDCLDEMHRRKRRNQRGDA